MTHQDVLRDFPLAVSLIEAEEGFRPTPYKCPAGVWTAGYGTNLPAHGIDHEGLMWTRAQAEAALLDELEIIVAELDRRWPGWRNLDDIRKAVILSAVYQLGIYGAAQFKATIAALIGRDFTAASERLLASRWAKQTPARVNRNAEAIRTGKLPEVVNGVRIFDAETDGGMVQAQEQPAASVVSPPRSWDAGASSPLALPPLRDVAPAVPVTKLLSKKLCVVIAGALVLLLNEPLHFGLSPQDSADMVKLLASYLIGQAGVDAFKPFATAILKGGVK